MNSLQLALALLARDLRERYLSTFAGLAWVLLTPVLLLAIFSFVFVQLLGARFGSRVGGDVIAFLALGLWSWHAFADAVARGTGALAANSSLIAQIALPRVWLVLVPVLGAVIIQTVSLTLVVVLLLVTGKATLGPGWALALLAYLELLGIGIALALLLAPLNVFFRDVSALLPQVLTFWMMLTPIFFDRAQLKPAFAEWLLLNPVTPLIETLRNGILDGATPAAPLLVPGLVALGLLLLAWRVSPRFLARIEDFL